MIAFYPGLIDPAFEPATNLKLIPKTTDIYLLVGDKDTSVGSSGAIELDRRLLKFGSRRKRIHGGIVHSTKGFTADHGSDLLALGRGERAICGPAPTS